MSISRAFVLPLVVLALAPAAGATPLPSLPKLPPPKPSPPEPLYWGRPQAVTIDEEHPVGRLRFAARTKSEIRITARRQDLLEPLRGQLVLRVGKAGPRGALGRPLAEARARLPNEVRLDAVTRERGEYLLEVQATAGSGDAPAIGATVSVTLACAAKSDLACALAGQPGNPCGPRDPCDAGLLCKPAEGCRGGGSCVVRPRACPGAVACRAGCGCDGRAYCTECEAERAGTFLAHDGACAGAPCTASTDCGPGAYCELPVGGCERDDVAGACRPRPASCPKPGAPVCGCDGASYPSACEAALSGVSVAARGACPKPGTCASADDCHGLLPQVCEVCRDGRTVCAHFTCAAGRCVTEMCPRN